MHHTITRKLYDAFPPERKGDFWAAYLYLKYTEHFFNKALEVGGLQPKELPPLDPAVEEMLYAVAWEVSEKAMSAETSLYHGKIVRPQDARKLVTQKEDLRLSPPERVVPFKVARDIVLENPSSIVVGIAASVPSSGPTRGLHVPRGPVGGLHGRAERVVSPYLAGRGRQGPRHVSREGLRAHRLFRARRREQNGRHLQLLRLLLHGRAHVESV
jgi:hypothetical protein